MASSLNKKGGSTSSLHKPPSANSLRGYNEQLRSIQQVLARQFAGSQPSSSQKQNPQTSPIRAKKQQETSKPAIPSEGSTAEDAIEVKSEDEDSMNDDFSHRGNYSLSSYTFFTPDLTGVTAPLRASSDQKEDTRYADAEDAEMSQNDAAESDFIFPEDRTLRLQSSVQTPTAQMQPSVPKRSRSSGSSNGDAPRSAKQIRSPEKEPFNTNISSVTQQYGAQKDNTSQDTLILQKTKENLDLRAQLSATNPHATLEAARLRAQLANLSSEARARDLVVQEYISNWQRASDEGQVLQSKFLEEKNKAKELSKMVEALRKKGERDARELEKVKGEHGAMVEAARRLFGIEAMRAMACEEFGAVGEALEELFRVVARQKGRRGH